MNDIKKAYKPKVIEMIFNNKIRDWLKSINLESKDETESFRKEIYDDVIITGEQ